MTECLSCKKNIWFVMMTGSKAFTKRKESLTKVTVKFYFLNIFCAIVYEKYLFLKMFFKETSRIRFINIREHFRSSFWNLVPIYEFLEFRSRPVILWCPPSMVSNTDSCLSIFVITVFLRNFSQGFSDFPNDASDQ